MTTNFTAGSEILVNSYTSSDQIYPTIAPLAGGGYVITWQSGGQDGSENGIYAQRYDANGVAVGEEFRVNTYVNSFQEKPVVTGLSDGGYIIAWSSNGQDGSSHGIYAQRYGADGVPVGSETLINTYTSGAQAYPSISALSDGGYVVVWVDYAQDGSGIGVYAQRFDASGVAVGSESLVNTYTSNNQYNMSITALSGGGYVIAWQSDGQDGSASGVYFQRYDASGNKAGGETRANTYTSGNQLNTSVTGLDDGGFVVAWSSEGQDGSGHGIYIQRYDASGATVGIETMVNTQTADQQAEPAVTALGDGGFIVTWQSDGQDGSGNGIYAQRYDVDGAVVGGEFLVNATTAGSQAYPAVTVLANGDLVFTWHGPDADGYGIYQRVFAIANAAPTGSPSGTIADGTEDTEQLIAMADLLAGFDDSDGDTLTVSAISADHGVLTATSGGWTFTPEANYNGAVTLTYTVSDGKGGTLADQTLSFSLAAVSDQPSAPDYTVSTNEDTPLVSSVAATDPDGDSLYYSLWSNVSHGSLSFDSDGSYTYTPNANYFGTDSFQYFVYDGDNLVTATVDITINSVNDLPEYSPSPLTFGSETRVNSYTNDQQYWQDATALVAGGYVVVWQSDGQDGSSAAIIMQRFDATGNPVGSETRVNSTTNDSQQYPAVTALNAGGFVVTWMSNNQDGSSWGVYAQRYDAAGNALGSETLINATTASSQTYPDIVALSNGGYVVIWTADGSQDGSNAAIYSRIYDADGVAQTGEVLVNTTTYEAQRYASVTALSTGGYVVTWQSWAQDTASSGWGIFAQRFDNGGTKLGAEFQVNTTTSNDQENAVVAGLTDGGFVISWTSYDGSDLGVYAQRYDASGNATGSEVHVSSYTNGDQTRPSITALADGGYIILWSSNAQDGDSWGIYAQVYDASGAAVGGEFRVNSTKSGSQDYPTVIQLANGDLVFNWASYGQAGDGNFSVYQRLADITGLNLPNGTQNTTYTVTLVQLLNGYSDPEGSSLSVVGLSADHGTVNDNGDGTFSIIPDANYSGNVTLSYSVSDGTDSISGNLSFILISNNTAPISDDLSEAVDEDGTLDGTVSATDSDGDTLTYSVVTGPEHGDLTLNSDGTYTYTPNANYNGSDSFTYLANDGSDDSNTATVSLTVNSINDALTRNYTPSLPNMTEDGSYTLNLADLIGGIVNIDNDTLTVTSISADHATLTDNGNGTWTVTPTANYNGALIYSYTVSDGQGSTLSTSMEQTISAVNDAPTGAAPVLSTGSEDVTYTVTGTQLKTGFTDADGDSLSIQNVTASYSEGYVGDTAVVGTVNTNAVFGITALASGGYAVSSRYYDGSNKTVIRIYDSSDNVVASINNAAGTLVGLSDGSFVVMSVVGVGSTNDIVASHYSATGTLLGTSTIADSTTAHEQYGAAVALDDGSYIVTWTEYGTTDTVIKFRKFNADGTAAGNIQQVTTSSGSAQFNSQIAQLSDGTLVVSWTQMGGDGGGTGVMAQRFAADGTSLGAAAVVNTVTTSHQHGVRMTALEGGGYVISWSDNSAWARKFQVYSADGNKVGSEVTLANTYVYWLNNGSYSMGYVASEIMALSDGGFAIVSAVSDGQQYKLFRYDASGNLLGTPVTVPSDTSNPYTSNVYAVTLADGSVHVVWTNEGNGNALMNRNFAEGLNGSATVTYNAATDTYSITRPADTNGLLTISYEVSDGNGGTKTASTTLNITALNDAPRGSSSTVLDAINEDGSITVTRAQLLAGYSDVDSAAISIRNNTVTSSNGTVTYNSSAGTWTITPAANYNGTVTLTYTVWDGTANAATGGSLSFAVNAVNDAPTLTGAKATISGATEDVGLTLTLAQLRQGYSDIDGDTISVSSVSADHGTITDNGDGTWSLTPEANYNGTVVISYTLSDGNGGSLAASLNVSVAAVNDAPTGSSSGTVSNGTEDTTQVILATDLLTGFSDAEGDTLSISSISVNHGTLTATTGGWTFTPDENYNGTVTLTYSVSDGHGGVLANQTKSFSLSAVNDSPDSFTDPAELTGTEDQSLTITLAELLEGYGDVDGDTLTVSGVSVNYGTITNNGNGTWTLVPEANSENTVAINYTISDGHGATISARLYVPFEAVNDAPTGSPTGVIADGTEDTTQVILATTLLAGFSDVEGDTLSISSISADHGTLTDTSGGWVFTPEENYTGAVTLTFTVSDSFGATLTDQTVSFNLAATNDAPIGTPTGIVSNGTEDTTQVILASSLLAGFSDVEGDTLSVSSISADHGTLTETAGGWTFTPDENYNGAVTLTYTVSDGQGGTLVDQTRSFSLSAVNDALTRNYTPSLPNITEDGSYTLHLDDLIGGIVNIDNDTLTVTSISADHATLTDNGNGTWTVTPTANYSGALTYSYTVSDGQGSTLSTSLEQTISAVNDAPTGTASATLGAGTEDTTYIVSAADLLLGFSDSDGESLTVVGLNADYGSVIDNGNGTYSITPNTNYSGNVTLSYDVIDGRGGSVGAQQTFVLNPVADVYTGTTGNDLFVDGNGSDPDTYLGKAGIDTISYINADAGVTTNLNNTAITTGAATGDTYTSFENLYGSNFDDNLRGNAVNNIIKGFGGNDLLTSTIGTDTLYGGSGDDTYFIYDQGTVISELNGSGADEGGNDVIKSTVSIEMASYIETLYLMGNGNINGYGNTANNILYGNSGNNILDGGLGADTLRGGLGDDSYYVDSALDVIVENTNEGTDTVFSAYSYTLGATLEYLTLTGSADLRAYGNSLGNRIIGNSGNNFLSGLEGADSMAGGAGNDTYLVDNLGDVITEDLTGDGDDGGNDRVNASVSFTLNSYIETLYLTGAGDINGYGNAQDNSIYGTSGNNIIDGGAGADYLRGGLGDDTYYIDSASDKVLEGSDEGTDTVYSSVSYTLGTATENLILTGSADVRATGNGFNNYIEGNVGKNVLNGLAGADTMFGLSGDDIYWVDNSGDVVNEDFGANGDDGGVDIVNASIDYVLGDYIEALYLKGTDNLSATGNSLNNTILGNTGNNAITGGAGNDNLLGGAGNDSYVYQLGFGRDTITDTSGVDSLVFGAGITASMVIFEDVGADRYYAIYDGTNTASKSANRIKIVGGAGGAVIENIVYSAPPPAPIASLVLAQAITSFSAETGGSDDVAVNTDTTSKMTLVTPTQTNTYVGGF